MTRARPSQLFVLVFCACGGATTAGDDAGSGTDVDTGPPPPPPAGILFASDFTTELGSSENAVGDGGRWDLIGAGFEESLEVVPSAGLDFPSPNVLRVTATAARTGFSRIVVTTLPQPVIGESRFYRFYFRAMWPAGLEDNATHPIEDDNARGWAFTCSHDGTVPGTWQPYYGVDATTNGWERFRWYVPEIQKGVTYRFENQLERIGDTTFHMHVRVYDAAGALLYDDEDILGADGTLSLSSVPELVLPTPDSLQRFQAGNNGIGGDMPPFPFVYAYEGAFCIRADTWCGPYQPGEAAR
jgi:hypothetical protein